MSQPTKAIEFFTRVGNEKDAHASIPADTPEDRVARVAETAAFLIDFETDPKTAELDDPIGPPHWNKLLNSFSEGILSAYDQTLSGNPTFEQTARAYVDECFEWHFGQTPWEYAAEREAKFAPPKQQDLFQDYLWEQDFGADSSTFDAIKSEVDHHHAHDHQREQSCDDDLGL